MLSQDIKKVIAKLPDNPGVYLFMSGKRILYIGKATSLKDRVRSYFSKDIVATRSPLVSKMLTSFTKIDFIKTDSVLEALVLEAHLIKKHQPEANIKEKDNKSFNFVVITKEDFPRVLVVRGRELLHRVPLCKNGKYIGVPYVISYSFGPFPNGSQLKEAMKIVRKMFPYRDKCVPTHTGLPGPMKPCFNYQIGLCSGVCIGAVSEKEYAKTIENIKTFFEGNKKKLIKDLEKQMKAFAKAKEFEKANKIKKTIFTLNHIQDISLIKDLPADAMHQALQTGDLPRTPLGNTFRIESYDIAHMSGQNVVGVMTVVEDGEVKKSDYRKFKIRNNPGVSDTAALKEVLERRLAHIEWKFPDLVVVDGGRAQKNIVEKILKKNGQDIPVVSVVKDERHRQREIMGDRKWLKYEKQILLSNLEAHRYAISFHRQLRGKLIPPLS